MLRHVGECYDDLKRRYVWTLERLAEMTILMHRLAEDRATARARAMTLGDSWWDFCRQAEEREEDPDPPQRRGDEDADSLLGRMLWGDGSGTSFTDLKEQKKSGWMCTKVTRSPKLLTIEDLPKAGGHEERRNGRNKISEILHIIRKSKKKENGLKIDEELELTDASEIKLQNYALMAEVAERDELIDSLNEQMKIKDVQIAQLLDVIHRGKFNLQDTEFSAQSDSSKKEGQTFVFKE